MKRMQILGLVCMMVLGMSCEGKSSIPLLNSGKSKPLSAVKVWRKGFPAVESLACLNGALYIFPMNDTYTADIRELEYGDDIFAWIMTNRDNEEVNNASYCNGPDKYGQIWMYNAEQKKLCEYRAERHFCVKFINEYDGNHLPYPENCAVLSNRLVVGPSPVSDDNTSGSLAMWNLNGKSIKEIGLCPDEMRRKVPFDKEVNMTDMATYSSKVSAVNNHFAQALEKGGYIAFYELNEKDYSVVCRREWITEDIRHKSNEMDVPQGFVDVKMTDEYVFCAKCDCIQDGRRYAKTILVFDHKGKLLQHYKLDRKANCISVSYDGKSLYAGICDPAVGVALYHLE